jgi:hypothetical protein
MLNALANNGEWVARPLIEVATFATWIRFACSSPCRWAASNIPQQTEQWASMRRPNAEGRVSLQVEAGQLERCILLIAIIGR